MTIGRNDYVWDAMPFPGHPLSLQQGANGPNTDIERLVVT